MKKNKEEDDILRPYRFYRERRNDPEWRSAYLKARQQRLMWIFIVITFLLLISSIIFLAYNYSNAGKTTPTELFNKSSEGSIESIEVSSSLSLSSSSSSDEELRVMSDLELNTEIAVLAQAYFTLNPSSSILQASRLAMSNSWDNGPIEWYDQQGAKHKLNVRVVGDTITYEYVDPTTGRSVTQNASVDEAIRRFLLPTNAIKATEQIALKVVAPAELHPNDGGHAGAGDYNDVSSLKENAVLFFEQKDIQNIRRHQLSEPIVEAAQGDISSFYGTYTSSKDGNKILLANDARTSNYVPILGFLNPTGTGVGSDNEFLNPIAAGRSGKGHLDIQTDFIEYPFKDAYGKMGVLCLTASQSPQSSEVRFSLITFVGGERIDYELLEE